MCCWFLLVWLCVGSAVAVVSRVGFAQQAAAGFHQLNQRLAELLVSAGPVRLQQQAGGMAYLDVGRRLQTAAVGSKYRSSCLALESLTRYGGKRVCWCHRLAPSGDEYSLTSSSSRLMAAIRAKRRNLCLLNKECVNVARDILLTVDCDVP